MSDNQVLLLLAIISFCDLNVWFRGDSDRRNQMKVSLKITVKNVDVVYSTVFMYYCLNVCFQECKFAKQELHKLRRENGSLDSERHEHSKTLSQLQTRVAVLEQELRDKEQVAIV